MIKTTIIDAAIKANILIKNNRNKFPSDLFEGIEQLDRFPSSYGRADFLREFQGYYTPFGEVVGYLCRAPLEPFLPGECQQAIT